MVSIIFSFVSASPSPVLITIFWSLGAANMLSYSLVIKFELYNFFAFFADSFFFPISNLVSYPGCFAAFFTDEGNIPNRNGTAEIYNARGRFVIPFFQMPFEDIQPGNKNRI